MSVYSDVMSELLFREWLADRRHEAGLTQTDLGVAVSVGQTAVQQWEDGKTRPLRKHWPAIAATLGVDVTEIQRRIEAERPARRIESVRGVSRRRGTIAFLGRVPADRSRLAAIEEISDVRDVPDDWVRSARHELVAVEASGDCLTERGIHDGDIVVCERVDSRDDVPQGRVVLARIAEDVTLKIWYWTGPATAELRDGSGNLAMTVCDGEDVEVVAIARYRYGPVV